MRQQKSNIILVGMPGSGKSTLGRIIAKRLSYNFVDSDVLIQESKGKSLQAILDQEGYLSLREVEESILLDLNLNRSVIATGGSAAYSDTAMTYLKTKGIVIFLNVDLPALVSRIDNFESRGIAGSPDQTFSELYAQRQPLYIKYADFVIHCNGLAKQEICDRIIEKI